MGANPPPFSEFLQQSEKPTPSFSDFLAEESKAPKQATGPNQQIAPQKSTNPNGMTIGPARDRGILERLGDVVEPITSLFSDVTPDQILAPLAKDAAPPLERPLLKFSEFLDQGAAPTLPQPIVAPGAMGGVPAAPNPELLRGAERGALEGAESLTTPSNLLLTAATTGAGVAGPAGKAAAKAGSGAFTASMLNMLKDQVPEAYDSAKRGDGPEAARLIVQAGLTALFAGAGARDVTKGKPRIMEQPLTALEAEGVRANVPETGKALKRAAGKATDDPILQQQLDQLVEERKAAALPKDGEPGQASPKQSQKQRRAAVEPEETAFEPGDPASETKGASDGTIQADLETKAPVTETIPPPGETAAATETIVREPVAAQSGLGDEPASPPAATREVKAEPVDPFEVRKPKSKPLHEMGVDELDAALAETRHADKGLEDRLFGGPEAGKRYRDLQRRANSTMRTFEETKAASDEIERMESGLSEEQRHELFNGAGHNIDDIKDLRSALGNIDASSPQALGQSLQWAATRFDPENPLADKRAYAQMRHAAEVADSRGWDSNEVSQAMYKAAARRFRDPEDAAYMLERFRKTPADAARMRLKAISERGSFSNRPKGGPSPLEDLITVGRDHFERGVRKFSEFRKAMIEEYGRPIQQHLGQAWQRLSEMFHPREGEHGPITHRFTGRATEAVDWLVKNQGGDARAALHHPEIGPIDLIWGRGGANGFGLAKIIDRHPEVLEDIQGHLSRMKPVADKATANTIQLDSPTHQAVVRRNWKGAPKDWLLTEYAKKEAMPSAEGMIDVSGAHATGRQAPPSGGTSSVLLNSDLVKRGKAVARTAKGFGQWFTEMRKDFPDTPATDLVRLWNKRGESGSLQVKNPAAKSAPPAPPDAKAIGVDEATPPSDRVKTSPSYDQTKGKILEKLAVSDDTKAAMADSMGKWETANPERQVIGFSDIVKEARALDPSLVAELKVPKAGETLNPAVRFAARETLNGIQDELVTRRKQLAELPMDALAEDRARLERQVDGLDGDAQRLLDVLIPTRSQDGRNLAYHRMMAEKSFDPTYWLSRARSKAGGVLPDKVRGELEGILAEGREAERQAAKPATPRQNRRTTERRTGVEPAQPEARPKSEVDADPAVQAARRKLAKKMVEVEKSSFLDTIAALRKAGLLTGAKTHLRNLGGNASFQVLEEARRVPSAAADLAMSLFSGKRTVLGPDFTALREASKAAATKGWREAKEVWADGATREQLEQFDTNRELNSGWGPMVRIPFTNESRPLVDAYVNQTFRLLGAEDRLFKAFAFERSIQEQMKVSGKNRQPVEQPTTTMITQAMQDAEVATFNNSNLVADSIVNKARQGLRQDGSPAARAALFGFDTVVPFVKTPTNIIARVVEYAGGGTATAALRTARAIAKQSLSEEQQRAISISFGRGATGLGLLYMGYQLAANGFMTGSRESSAGRQNAEEAAGRPPGSILVNGKWHQVGAFSPAGNLLVTGATLQRQFSGGFFDTIKKDPFGSALQTGALGLKTVSEQPLLTGANTVADAVRDPERSLGRAITSTAGSFIPTFLNDIGSVFDDVRRDARGETFIQSVVNAWKARVPGVRNSLPARVDVLGREQKQERTAAIDPTLSQAQRTDAVSRELVETKASVSGLKRKPSENAAGFRARSIAEGKMAEAAIRELLADPEYRAEAPETRREIINKAISGLRSQIGRNILNTEEYQRMKPSEQMKLWQEMTRGN